MDKKRIMRHTDEIHAILTAIYCINETTAKDEDIAKLIEYSTKRHPTFNFISTSLS